MSASIEAELRLLVRQVSERATLAGGMDRQAYDALIAANAVLSSMALADRRQGREEALLAVQERLRACEAEPYVRAA
ncbi:hypothetical protein ACU4GR_32610 (plasmid) [Methylobacterium oryzae CBMB20]